MGCTFTVRFGLITLFCLFVKMSVHDTRTFIKYIIEGTLIEREKNTLEANRNPEKKFIYTPDIKEEQKHTDRVY